MHQVGLTAWGQVVLSLAVAVVALPSLPLRRISILILLKCISAATQDARLCWFRRCVIAWARNWRSFTR